MLQHLVHWPGTRQNNSPWRNWYVEQKECDGEEFDFDKQSKWGWCVSGRGGIFGENDGRWFMTTREISSRPPVPKFNHNSLIVIIGADCHPRSTTRK